MLFIKVLALEFYIEYAPIKWLLKGGGFLLDIATPARVWLHIEAEYMQVLAVLLIIAIIRRRRR